MGMMREDTQNDLKMRRQKSESHQKEEAVGAKYVQKKVKTSRSVDQNLKESAAESSTLDTARTDPQSGFLVPKTPLLEKKKPQPEVRLIKMVEEKPPEKPKELKRLKKFKEMKPFVRG